MSCGHLCLSLDDLNSVGLIFRVGWGEKEGRVCLIFRMSVQSCPLGDLFIHLLALIKVKKWSCVAEKIKWFR